MVVKLRRKDLKDPELTRHGDSAVMLALLWFATMNLSAPIDTRRCHGKPTAGMRFLARSMTTPHGRRWRLA